MKILFADKFPQHHLQQLEQRGHDCASQPDLAADRLPGALAGFDVLVVRSTRVEAGVFEAADRLALVIRAGAGTNTIDTRAAVAHGVPVCNVPGRNALAVAELTLGLLLAIDRRIPDNVADLRAGRWNKKRYAAAQGLYARRIGIVGLGAIGLAVAERAAAFGMRIRVIERAGRDPDTERRLAAVGAERVADLEALAAHCEVLSLHLPAATDTKALINDALLERMPDGAILLNTARGDLVDEAALRRAMDSKGIRAGLDVYCDEPASGEGAFDSALARHPNVYGTHHIGASTAQAQHAVADGVLELIAAFEAGRVLNCVNGDTETQGAAP